MNCMLECLSCTMGTKSFLEPAHSSVRLQAMSRHARVHAGRCCEMAAAGRSSIGGLCSRQRHASAAGQQQGQTFLECAVHDAGCVDLIQPLTGQIQGYAVALLVHLAVEYLLDDCLTCACKFRIAAMASLDCKGSVCRLAYSAGPYRLVKAPSACVWSPFAAPFSRICMYRRCSWRPDTLLGSSSG